MKHKYLFGGIAFFFFVSILFYICLNVFFVGTKLWGMLVPHTTLTVDDMKSVEEFNDYYEQRPNPNASYESIPSYTKSELFGEECQFIFFGEVLSCENYVFKEEYNGVPITYSCHTVKLSVGRSIYGNLRKGQEVYLLCRWHHGFLNNDIPNNSMQKGKKGIFITNGLPIKIHFNQSGTSIMAIGSLRHTRSYHYCLTSMLPEKTEELENLKTKQDVISFWEDNGMLWEESEMKDLEED